MRHDLPPEVVEQLEQQHAQDVANIRKLYNGRPPLSAEEQQSQFDECSGDGNRRLLLIPLLISAVSVLGLLWFFFRDLVGVAPWWSM